MILIILYICSVGRLCIDSYSSHILEAFSLRNTKEKQPKLKQSEYIKRLKDSKKVGLVT